MSAADADPELQLAKERAFAALQEVGEALADGRLDAMAAPAGRLRAQFDACPDGELLAGFGTMVLDGALWLIAGGRDEDALGLCGALVDRLVDGIAPERAVAAGARFLQAQAYGRLGRDDRARASIEALCAMGEPALAALDRLATRFVSAGADPAWHAQLAAASVTVLWRLGRSEQARAIAREAAAAFTRAGEPQLAAMLLSLADELGGEIEPTSRGTEPG